MKIIKVVDNKLSSYIKLINYNLRMRRDIIIPFCIKHNKDEEITKRYIQEYYIYNLKFNLLDEELFGPIKNIQESAIYNWMVAENGNIEIDIPDYEKLSDESKSIIINFCNDNSYYDLEKADSSAKLYQLLSIDEIEYGEEITNMLFEYSDLTFDFYKDKVNSIGRTYEKDKLLCKSVTFQVTDACNLKCTYCYQISKHNNKMSKETGRKIVDLLYSRDDRINGYIDEIKTPSLILDFIGGEPLLAIDSVRNIYEYFLSKGIDNDSPWVIYSRPSFSTNGTLYFSEEVQKFIKEYAYAISLSVTVDGNKELHDACRVFENGEGSYDLAFAAAMDWKNYTGHVGSKITLSPYNIDHMNEAISSLLSAGYKLIHANTVFEEGWTIDHAIRYYSYLKELANYMIDNKLYYESRVVLFDTKLYNPMIPEHNDNWCGGLGSMLAFDPNGEAYPCLRYMESSLGSDAKPIVIGNADRGITTTEEEKAIIKDMDSVTRRSQSTDECFNCPIASGCSWCSAHNYQVFGTYNKRATFICEMHRAESLANVYYWNKIFTIEKLPYVFEMYLEKENALKIIGEDEYNYLVDLCNNIKSTGEYSVVNKIERS